MPTAQELSPPTNISRPIRAASTGLSASNGVSGNKIRILKICDRRLARKKNHRRRPNTWNFLLRRPTDLALTRGNTAGVHTSRNAPQRRRWLADDPFQAEPVSGFNSLLSGKNTGNFRYYGANTTSLTACPASRSCNSRNCWTRRDDGSMR